MAGTFTICSNHLVRILAFSLLFPAFCVSRGYALEEDEPESNLVRVNIVTRIVGANDTVEINGRVLTDNRPVIIQAFSSTGIVLDRKGHIMIFLGFRWLDIQGSDPAIEISDHEGHKWKGELVGIDQSNGVAVITVPGGKLKKTPLCEKCEIRDGTTVMAPVPRGYEIAQFTEAEIVSVGAGAATGPAAGQWTITLSRPFPDIGQPILTKDRRVLGFIASQDPLGIQNVVYPVSQLLDSAEKILKQGSDIRTGWLGIYLLDAELDDKSGVLVERVEPDSPAERAGLAAHDFLVRYDGHRVKDSRDLIHLVQNTPIGSRVKIEMIRRGTAVTITAPVEARRLRPGWGRLSFNLPDPLGSPVAGTIQEQSGNPRGLIGLDTILLTPPLASALQLSGQAGLLVVDVARQMPAERAGVLVGDVIVAMDGRPITDAPGFTSYLLQRDWGQPAVLRVLRQGIERDITIQIEKQKSEF